MTYGVLVLCLFLWNASAIAQEIESARPPRAHEADEQGGGGYVARGESIQQLLQALSTRIRKPIISSQRAQKKTVSGDFDFSRPRAMLEKLGEQIGLIWFDDGQAIYVYDSGEMKNAVISLKNISLGTLTEFLRKSRMLDPRFPLRGDFATNTFYIAAPPIYVDTVTAAAAQLDSSYGNTEQSKEKIEVIQLHNTFVEGRTFELRDKTVHIPGVGAVLANILSRDSSFAGMPKAVMSTETDTTTMPGTVASPPVLSGTGLGKAALPGTAEFPSSLRQLSAGDADGGQVRIINHPETNSILVRGSAEQVQLVRSLVAKLDVARRQIELSLWMIDISRDDLDRLGVDWKLALGVGRVGNITFNNPAQVSSLDGNRFLAAVHALSQNGSAQVVSRPIVLTQENIPAIFDNNNTFYTKLEGERQVALQPVTFGTLISVLPRISGISGDIEMILNIEDGMPSKSVSESGLVGGIPVVGRTKINTVARVPQNLSLLIGGYSRDQFSSSIAKIPLLGDLPFIGGLFRHRNENTTKLTRVFLIQPRVVNADEGWDAVRFDEGTDGARDIGLGRTLGVMRKRIEADFGFR